MGWNRDHSKSNSPDAGRLGPESYSTRCTASTGAGTFLTSCFSMLATLKFQTLHGLQVTGETVFAPVFNPSSRQTEAAGVQVQSGHVMFMSVDMTGDC